MQVHGRRYDTAEAVSITLQGERIGRVDPFGGSPVATQKLPWLAPGFLDIQINGYGGQEFSSLELTAERVADIVEEQLRFGVTRFCPTLTTESFEVLAHGMRAISAACEQSPHVEVAVAGIHLEGPYISSQDGPRGAHPAEHCKAPELEEFLRLQDAAGGRIKILTLSPEYPQSPEFVADVTRRGVIVAIGHTSADSEQIRAAVDAGARLSTHLGNGAHGMIRRHPNYIWDQMAEDRLMASLIVDGHHLPAAVVQSIVRAKTPKRCIIVSDLSGLAGLPPGKYDSSGCDLEILGDGRLVIAGQDQLLAGASLPIGTGIANMMRFGGVELKTAVDMASVHPAELLGCKAPNLQPGDRTDLVLFDVPEDSDPAAPASLDVRATVCGGELVYGAVD